MASLLRISLRAPRAHLFTNSTRLASLAPRRFAGDYGSVQGGQEQGINEKNPMKHLEHPGPESPMAKGQSSESKNGSSPAIHQPKSPQEDQDPEVKKHNEGMKNRTEKSENQLGQEDNKVDKKFWKGS